ncbi:MAG: hypothetical protein HFJ54_06580 [Clostridia bacterium]|nr:hypothetical protein [Clostridia bacterium]
MKKTVIIAIVVIAIIIAIIVGFFVMKPKKELKLQTTEEIQNMLNTIYSSGKVELPSLDTAVIDKNDTMQVTSFTGLQSSENIEELVVSVPFINSQAYSLAVIKVSEKADIDKMKKEIFDNIDMRRWICVSAEKLYITNYENVIFLVMSSEEWAKPVYEEFKKYVENDIGKELEKTEEENIELPPEL